MSRSRNTFSVVAWALLAASASGCGLVLGLGDFKDAPGTSGGTGGGGSGTGGATSTTSDTTVTTSSAGGGGASGCSIGTTQGCYTGPAGTEGKGLCTAGTQTCQPDGTWGACSGDVTPGVEDCNAKGDEDCDGFACSETEWAFLVNGQKGPVPKGLAIDPTNGDIVLIGTFIYSFSFPGGQPLIGSGETAFIAKLNAKGEHVWSAAVPNAQLTHIDVDKTGAILISGTAFQATQLGNSTIPPGTFVAKTDSTGLLTWVHGFDVSSEAGPVKADPNGDLRFVTSFSGTPDFFGNGLIQSRGPADYALLRLDGVTGVIDWGVQIGGSDTEQVDDITVDPIGNTMLVGSFSTEVIVGPSISDQATGDRDGFITRVESNGVIDWLNSNGSAGTQTSFHRVASDLLGNPVVVGSGNVNFGDGQLNGGFVVKFHGQAGNADWSGSTSGYAIGIDKTGESALAGGSDFVVEKLSSTGDPVWNRLFGQAAPLSYSIAITPQTSEITVVGLTTSTLSFDTGPLTPPAGEMSMFIARIAP